MNKISEIVARVQTLNGEIKWLNEHPSDLQTRSMRGKLDIFDDIQEQAEEDTERVLKTFIKRKRWVKIRYSPSYVEKDPRKTQTNREHVRRAAPWELKNKPYGVNE